ncbi:DgyrCDS7398 [Dimorphilus gyrociliatus]|uniref:DgyrCDS7398 n=1 Tax=Dimorphilus gyrociliatus TaxID=2664684 RepID=A0A7I8VQY2_9ANNE|nr:DgyrCDS7398 [Dimorphilus gyrociliatus]
MINFKSMIDYFTLMETVKTLQVLTYEFLMKHIELYIEDERLYNEWMNKRLSPLLAGRLLFDLNDTLLFIPENILKLFNKDICFFKEIKLNCRNVYKNSSMEFLKGHALSKVSIEFARNILLKDWICFLDETLVTHLSIKGSRVSDIRYKEEARSIACVTCLKPFQNIVHLDISRTGFVDEQLRYISRELPGVEHLNMSETLITDLRHLEAFPKLNSLDCSFPLDIKVYGTYLALLRLKSLEYLDMSREDGITYDKQFLGYNYCRRVDEDDIDDIKTGTIPKCFLTKYKWKIDDFVNYANWPNLSYINMSGSWSHTLFPYIRKFIERHTKLKYLGLFGFETNMERNLDSIDPDIRQFIGITSDKKRCVQHRAKFIKANRGNESHFVYFLNWILGHSIDAEDEELKAKVKGIEYEIAEVVLDQLNELKHSVYSYGDSSRNIISLLDTFVVVRIINLPASQTILKILKTCAQVFLQNDEDSFWTHDLSDLFFIFNKYFTHLNEVADRSLILKRLFDHPNPNRWTSYSYVLCDFLNKIIAKKLLSTKEIICLTESFYKFEHRLKYLLKFDKDDEIKESYGTVRKLMNHYIRQCEAEYNLDLKPCDNRK